MENMTLKILKRKIWRKQITGKNDLCIKVCDFTLALLHCFIVYIVHFCKSHYAGKRLFVHTRKYCIYLFIFYFFSIILWSERGILLTWFCNNEWVEGEILVELSIVWILQKYYHKRIVVSTFDQYNSSRGLTDTWWPIVK